jgi:hypothetical protein
VNLLFVIFIKNGENYNNLSGSWQCSEKGHPVGDHFCMNGSDVKVGQEGDYQPITGLRNSNQVFEKFACLLFFSYFCRVSENI